MEFSDFEKEILHWQKDKSQQAIITIAVRASVRAYPAALTARQSIENFDDLSLKTSRMIVCAAVATMMPTDELDQDLIRALNISGRASQIIERPIISASGFAAQSAVSSFHSVDPALCTAIDSANCAAISTEDDVAGSSAHHDTLHAAFTDCNDAIASQPQSSFDNVLWPDGLLPNGMRELSDALLREVPKRGSVWSFWRNWYEGFLNGRPLDWELQKRVALIPDDVWENGVEAVAEVIKEIEANLIVENLAQAEEIEFSMQTEKYSIKPTVLNADALIERIFGQLDFSLDIALRGHNSSGFDELCVAYKYLKHSRDHCRDDPNGVHMNFRLAREIIENKLSDGTYYSEDGLNALVQAIERHEIQLRADHPDVRDAHDRFVEQRLRDMDDALRLALAEEFRGLRENSENRLEQEFGLDAEILETDSGVAAQKDAVKRSGVRSQRMALIEKAKGTVKTVDGSAGWKLTGIGMRLSKIVEILSSLL